MSSAPRTYRLSASPEKALDYMRRNQVDTVLVTTTDGQLFGVLKREDLEANIG
jgi:predicted transcriptional regulator